MVERFAMPGICLGNRQIPRLLGRVTEIGYSPDQNRPLTQNASKPNIAWWRFAKLEIAIPQRLSVGTGAIKVNGERPALEIVSHLVLSLKSSAPNNLAVSVLLWRWGRFFWAKKNPPT
jgi:hypothetical protein